MDVSIIVCTYNRADLLRETLNALVAQKVPSDLEWEVVVVDNNSRDATRAVVETARAAAPMSMTYCYEPRQGLSWARNTGIATAKGGIVAFTDDDAVPAADWVASIVAVLKDTGADVVGGRILPVWPGPVPSWLAHYRGLFGNLALMDYPTKERLVVEQGTPQVWGCNMAFRRDVFDRIGPFDTGLGRVGDRLYGGEDVDMVRRALAANLVVFFDPALVVWHCVPLERMRRRYFLRWHFQGGEGETRFEAATPDRVLLGAPLYRYREAFAALGRWLWAASLRRPNAMELALDLAHAVGSLVGYWKKTFARIPRRPS